MEDPLLPSTWELRRRVIFATLAFCAFCVVYILIFGDDSRINETIATAAFTLAGAVIGSYVFGVAYTDITRIKALSEKPRVSDQKAERPSD